IYAIGLGQVGKDYDEGVLLYIAGDPSRYFPVPKPKDLARVFKSIAGTFCGNGPPPPTALPPTPVPPTALPPPSCDRPGVDVVLVLDMSRSMERPTLSGQTKYAAAVDASLAFVDQLTVGRDQAAVVWFNSQAVIEQPLSGTKDSVTAAIRGLPA